MPRRMRNSKLKQGFEANDTVHNATEMVTERVGELEATDAVTSLSGFSNWCCKYSDCLLLTNSGSKPSLG